MAATNTADDQARAAYFALCAEPPRYSDDAYRRSMGLLRHVLQERERNIFDLTQTITVEGKSGKGYLITVGGTRIFEAPNGKEIGRACLQSTAPVPVYDRMLAEYLLISNDERRYHRTANVYYAPGTQMFWGLGVLAILDLALIGVVAFSVSGAVAINLATLPVNIFNFSQCVRNRTMPLWLRVLLAVFGVVVVAFNVWVCVNWWVS